VTLFATLALATFKFGTNVVLATVNGAVPVVIVLFNIFVVNIPVVLLNVKFALPPVTPASLNCTYVFRPAGVAVAVTPVNADPLPTKKLAFTLPVTLKLVSMPVLVMFGCALVITVPAKFA
jgi:hypothetical protein